MNIGSGEASPIFPNPALATLFSFLKVCALLHYIAHAIQFGTFKNKIIKFLVPNKLQGGVCV